MPEQSTEFIDALAAHVGTPPLSQTEIDAVLALAGVAAHGTGQRTNAPLATFLAGIAAARAEDRLEVLNELRRHSSEATDGGD